MAEVIDILGQRFWDKVEIESPDGCWLWSASTTHNGYGTFRLPRNGKLVRAHRLSYESAHGPIPDGMFVCHSCDTRNCVNPSHLFVGTAKENTADMMRKKRHRPVGPIGESAGASKLKEDEVRTIRACRDLLPQTELGRVFGVSQDSVSLILAGKTWKHI